MSDQVTANWIERRIDTIQQDVEDLHDVHSSVNEFNTLSAALKLILHSGSLNMYLNVAPNHFDGLFYIDCLAGSGLSEHDEGDKCFRGSPLIAAERKEEFAKMYFLEKDSDHIEALHQRLDYLSVEPSKYEIYEGDANEKIQDVIEDIWETKKDRNLSSFHTFTFIDNEGLDFKWESINNLVVEVGDGGITTDLLINYPTGGAAQEAPNRGDKVLDFFGTDLWKVDDPSRESLRELYEDDLRSIGKDIQEWVNIYSGTRSFEYDLVYATRETQGGSGYMDAVRHLRKFIERVDGNDVDQIIDGDQETISAYNREVEREIERDSEDQSGFEDF